MHRNIAILLLILLLILVSCFRSRQSPTIAEPTENSSAVELTDADIDAAVLDVELQTEALVGNEDGDVPDGLVINDSDEGDVSLSAQAQTTLTGASGLVCYSKHDPNAKKPWGLYIFNQIDKTHKRVYRGAREIDSIACSEDGNYIIFAVRERANETSDFEVYKLTLDPYKIERLTDDNIDQTNVSMDALASVVVWQSKDADKDIVVIRTYKNKRKFSQKILSHRKPQKYPSVSANGEHLVLIRTLAGGKNAVMLFDIQSLKYRSIFVNSEILEHPSLDDGANSYSMVTASAVR